MSRVRSSVELHPYHSDLPAVAARRILDRWGTCLPDLTGLTVLLPQPLPASDLRRRLLEAAAPRGFTALLGPRITTLADYLTGVSDSRMAVWGKEASLMALVEALRGHESLFGEEDTWRLAEHLAELFRDLTLYQVALPEDEDDFRRHLTAAYSIPGRAPHALEREAGMVYRLWQAWREQLQALQVNDPSHAYLDRLEQAGSDDSPLLLVGDLDLNTAELAWLDRRLRSSDCLWLLQGEAPPTSERSDPSLAALDDLVTPVPETMASPIADCLATVYATGGEADLRQRAAALAQRHPTSPLQDRLAILTADSAEKEALAIELQTRQWLLEGRRELGIVTEDRRLARRVRALLERAGIELSDAGGWALSTTSAATAVERWLESVEQGFEHQPLLDFLKSPFAGGRDPQAHLVTVYRFEHDIVLQGGIARGLNRYRLQLAQRQQLLSDWPAESYKAIFALLDDLGTAARELQSLLTGRHAARHYLTALQSGLDSLGVWEALQEDPAGERILQVWERLLTACSLTPLELDWAEFRTWFGRSLETAHFTPSSHGGPVRLLSLEQSQCLRFDGLIIGACDHEHLPGKPAISPFFNDRVRAELGLPVWRDRLNRQFRHFRRLLENADRVLLTRHCEDSGDPVLASPWLELLQSFHRLAYQDDLEDDALKQLLNQTASRVRPDPSAPLPDVPDLPRPALPAALRPHQFSASSYQRLMDCPYAFFAGDGLGLKPPEAIREALQKQDYGERVHLCLEAFHGHVRGLPGPFDAPLTEANRQAAIDLLQRIATEVFARDLEDNFQHRGWLKRWQEKIPAYIDWQIEHARQWRVVEVEQRVSMELRPDLTLKGRLDRVDTGENGLEIIDYKTGRAPAQEAVETGEAVQLPFYRLLLDATVSESTYLQLDGKRIQSPATLQGAELEQLSLAIRERLEALVDAMDGGAALPAWGDETICGYCDLDGVCRKPVWEKNI